MRLVTIIILLFLLLTGCSNTNTGRYTPRPSYSATSSESTTKPVFQTEAVPANGKYRVVPNDTIYSIARRYQVNLADLVKRNGLNANFHIFTGEIIYLQGYSPRGKRLAQAQENSGYMQETNANGASWRWPARGAVIGPFCRVNHGINISGRRGAAIRAVAAGKVIYSGNGLSHYGNLIIIEHNHTYLTAYAHNNKNLVHEGDWVKPGQEIAEMGSSGTNRVMLHFEVRRHGVPVNPMNYLAKG